MVRYLDLKIPQTYNGLPIVEIGNDVFGNYKYLSSVTIPNTIEKIGDGAFANTQGFPCRNIKFQENSNLKYIGARAFSQLSTTHGTSTLFNLVIPKSVIEIGDYAFAMTDWHIDQYVYFEAESSQGITFGEGAFRMYSSSTDYSMHTSNYTYYSMYYYSENKPSTTRTHWHYVDGVPTLWIL